MKIACLQFAPQVADIDGNKSKADAILCSQDLHGIDLLVFPEMALSGYNFKSQQEIEPYLEKANGGISHEWAKKLAASYNCTVVIGYPEKVTTSEPDINADKYFNSALVVPADGSILANYRKRHLYYTDDTWALEGDDFFRGDLPGIGATAMGICMDLNPYKFQAPWNLYEFASHAVESKAKLVILSMAWDTSASMDKATFHDNPEDPDMETLSYWLSRLQPLLDQRDGEEIIVVFANRTGSEENAVYVGTSTVVGIKDGEIRLYGMLGRGEERLLVVDTNEEPSARLRFEVKVTE